MGGVACLKTFTLKLHDKHVRMRDVWVLKSGRHEVKLISGAATFTLRPVFACGREVQELARAYNLRPDDVIVFHGGQVVGRLAWDHELGHPHIPNFIYRLLMR